MQSELVDVHDGDLFSVQALTEYLRWHFVDGQLPGLRLDDELVVAKFTGGHANLTCLVRAGGAEMVLRRPLSDAGPEGAERIEREFQCLTALHPLFPAAPRPYLFCSDQSVLGGVFYLMERRRGIVVRGREPMPLAGHVEMRRLLSEAVVDALVELHRVETAAGALATLGDPVGFVDRQVRQWTSRWQRSRAGDETSGLDAVALWLTAHEPPDALEPAVVHGTFTLENLIVNPLAPNEIAAVLDWESASLGDPLYDLGVLLGTWGLADTSGLTDGFAVTAQPGYLNRDQLLDRYARASGRDVSDIAFYEVLALFTAAVRLHEQRLRRRHQAPSDTVLAQLGTRAETITRRALQLAEG